MEIDLLTGGVCDHLAIRTPDGILIQPRGKRQTGKRTVGQFMNPYVLVATITVGLINGYTPPVRRQVGIGKFSRRRNHRAHWFPPSVKPYQLGLSGSPSRLHRECGLTRNFEK